MSKTFADLIAKVNECGTKKVAVAVAQDSAVLEAEIGRASCRERVYPVV